MLAYSWTQLRGLIVVYLSPQADSRSTVLSPFFAFSGKTSSVTSYYHTHRGYDHVRYFKAQDKCGLFAPLKSIQFYLRKGDSIFRWVQQQLRLGLFLNSRGQAIYRKGRRMTPDTPFLCGYRRVEEYEEASDDAPFF